MQLWSAGAMLIVLHSGQTGVERGAHTAAVAAGFGVAGFMTLEQRDELGPLPEDIARCLTPCFERGPRRAVHANVKLASGVLLVVPASKDLHRTAGMSALQQTIRAAEVPWLVADPASDASDVARWVLQLPVTSGSRRLLVTGPRATRWPDGEKVARRLVAAIAMTGPPGDRIERSTELE